MNFNQHVKRICIPEDRDNSVLKITSTEIENSEVDDETGETLVEYKALWRKPITVSFDPNGAEGSVPDVHTRYQLDWQLPSIATDSDPLLYHPSNYEFVGWSLDPSASSDKTGQDRQFVYDAGFDGPLDKDDFTMHAIWKQIIGGDEFITVYENDGPVKDDIYTIPYNGTYKFYVASGGGGGAAWWRTHNNSHKEGQGGNGYWGTFTCNLVKGDKVRIPSIGGGGAKDEHHGGNGGTNGDASGGDGGDTEVYVSGKFHVKMTGGQGGHAHGGTYDGNNGKLTMSDGVTVTQERMLRWVLPSSFGIPYAEELSAWALSALQDNSSQIPTANTHVYKNGKTYKEFWTTYLNTMPNFLDKYKGSANLEYGTPDIFQRVKKYRPGWTKYNSPSDNYKKSPNIISLSTTSVKYTDALGTTHAVWPKNSAGKYSCAFAGKQLDEIRDMAITRFGVSSTDGNRGTAAKKYASSGVHGCVKIVATTIDKCTVTWNGNGGSDPDSTEVENTFAIKTAISTLPTSTREGYTQNKWWTESIGGSEVTLNTIVNNSFTAYAHWTPNTYTITWNPNGGTVDPTSWSVTYGHTLGSHGALPVPTREGFEFGNWWTTSTGEGTQITTDTSVPPENTTYYARWNESRPASTGFLSVPAIDYNNCSWPFKQNSAGVGENYLLNQTNKDLEHIRSGFSAGKLMTYTNDKAKGFTITVEQWQSDDIQPYSIHVGASSNEFADVDGILFQWTSNQGPNTTVTYSKDIDGTPFDGLSVTVFVSNAGRSFDVTQCGINDFDEFKLKMDEKVVISASVRINWFYD